MKAAENRSGCDCADALNNPMDGCILVQSPMGPRAIIVCGVLAKDPAQVTFSEHDQMVEAFPPDRADQSLRVAVLPGRRGRDRLVPNAHGAKPAPDCRAVNPVLVPDYIAWVCVPKT